ncbi:T9SS type A sorting domain-containing protein [Salegentibacter salegens]|uniref:Por secretion system C-terminal sorting domain-containing protein n=1 Tax=Salegentibacter salegens TaxID=143223 RepID=A0A1M7NK31_9FLAO|nr:T9SS type A sorting domain-containing protein [Salegentibacter salegens]PRX41207.1 putative secreted protein (Por secretion system target) [Salegentibacter salegens]SHN04177.1 Por secretion system C-terminal sorting domain-containing protein [Salegentibacter salegens]
MKFFISVLFVLTPLLCQSQKTQNKNSKNKNLHSSINVNGGNISNAEGSLSYSIGQVYYSSHNEEEITVTEGVQQPLIIYTAPVEKTKKDFEVLAYPNPVANNFTIDASSYANRSLNYQIVDLNGRLLKEDRIEKPGSKIDISRFSAAIYLLRISDNDQHIKTIKIIKR